MAQTPIRIMIVSGNPDLMNRLLRVLMQQEDMVIAGLVHSLEEAIGQARQASPDIVLVGEHLEGAEERLRQLAIEAPFASVIALCPKEDTSAAQRALLAGARAFVPDPFTDDELCTTIREVFELEMQRRAHFGAQATDHEEPGSPSPRGKIFALISPKGGTGRSMIAMNLAVLLRSEMGKEVVLIEARHALGDLDTMLNLVPNTTLADLGPDASMIDASVMETVLLRHASGIRVLLAPPQLDELRVPDEAGFERILNLLREMFDYIVIDAGPLTDPYTSVILQHADRLLVIVVPEVPALQRAARFLSAARQHGFPMERIDLIVNRATARGGVDEEDIRERLGTRALFAVPDDVSLVTYATNQGIPLVVSHPKSAIASSLKQMTRQLVGGAQPANTLVSAAKPGFGMSRLRNLLGIM